MPVPIEVSKFILASPIPIIDCPVRILDARKPNPSSPLAQGTFVGPLQETYLTISINDGAGILRLWFDQVVYAVLFVEGPTLDFYI